MKKLITLTGCLVLLAMFTIAPKIQAQEVSVYQYRSVPPEHMEEFMNRVDTYWSKVAEASAKDGNLVFWALLRKMDGFDIPNSSNILSITTYKDLDKIQETWDPSTLFPNVSREDMNVAEIAPVVHRIYVRAGAWVEKEGVVPENDFNYVLMIYHDSDSPGELLALEEEHWGPFIKSAMDAGKTSQTAWGNSAIISPHASGMGATTISMDMYRSLNDAISPSWAEDLVVPEDGMAKIMELEENRRTQYIYKIERVVQAEQPN